MPETPLNPTLESVLEPRPEDQPSMNVVENQGVDATTADVIDAIKENAAVSEPTATPQPQAPATPYATPTNKPKWHAEPLANFQLNADGSIKYHPKTGKPIRGRGKGGRGRRARPGEKLAGGGVAPGSPAPGKPSQPKQPVTVIDPMNAPPIVPGMNPPDQSGGDDLDAAEVFTELADDVAQGVGGDQSRMTKAEKNTIQKGMGSMTRGRKVYGPLLFIAGLSAWCLRLWINKSKDATRDNEPRDDHRKHEDGEVNAGQAPGDSTQRGW